MIERGPSARGGVGPGVAGDGPTPAGGPAGDGVGILLVDDQPARLAALEAALSDMGEDVEIVHASSGKEALRCLLRRDFAVILLDVHMPVMDGFETAALVRQRARSERTPIIFVTALGPSEAQVTRGYSLGAVDYVFAPVLPEVLRTKVSVFLDLSRKTEQVRRQADWLREEAERRAAVLETRLRGLLDRLEVGVFRAAPDGRILERNRAFGDLLGFPSPGEVPRPLVLRLLAPAEEPAPPGAPPMEAAGRARDLLLEPAAGKARWVSVSTTAARGSSGEEVLDGILEDVAARKEAERNLREAHGALEEQAGRLARSNADLQRFAHAVSHDLQEPLRMVSTFLDLLGRRAKDRLDGECRQYLEYAGQGAERMQGMIRGLLDLCMLERTTSRVAPTDCGALVDRVSENLLVSIRESKARITRDDLPVLEGDGLLLSSVLQNLLGNALKFRRPEKAPRIHVSAGRRADAWVLSVRDNGMGIEEADKGRLFEVFHRLPGSEGLPGSGMGLALCRRIVERHGGRIWCEPSAGGGATFLFSIPDAPPVSPQGEEEVGR